jgi:hypothetical protein
MGPLALAVTAIAIGRRAIAETVIRKLRAEEIQIGSLKLHELEWPASAGPAPAAHQGDGVARV